MVRVGLVGVGGWGKNHARVLSELGALAAVCDMDIAKAEFFAKKYGVKAYDSTDKMLASEKIDVANICTPTTTHFSIAKQLLEYGLDIFVEKPLAATVEEGRKLVSLSEERKRIVGVGYIERFNPAVARLKQIVSESSLGELILAEFYRENRWGGVKDVGILSDTTVHDIDTARYIFGEEPQQVFCRTGSVMGPHEDFAVVMLGFKRHRTAILMTNWVTPRKERRLSAVFTSGVVTLDFVAQQLRIDKESVTEIPRFQTQEPLLLELKSFLDSVQNRSRPLVDAQEALGTSLIAEAAIYSSKKGLPVSLQV
ncbi:MAG: Gfo/Idh/MocA family oxidoreductase [Nitrososphaerota archaeon]|nr:Gfo/Idh/MocA family oxidoreductase [Nitrososphaerota archaeon]